MGVDTDVLLRVRDRAALRVAFEAHAAKERKKWADDGREAEYDELVAGGYDPTPLLRPLEDGSVSIFTGLRFHDSDMEYSIRCWLHALFGDALSRVHDDARGVFVLPDVCEPRAKTYDGIVAELKTAGRFIDPSPPTKAEEDARMKSYEEYVASMTACQDAKAAGDEQAFQRALATAPEDVRKVWAAQEEHAERMAALANAAMTFEDEDRGAIEIDGDEDEDAPPVDPALATRFMRLMMGLPEGATTDADGNPLVGTPEGLSEMFASMLERETAAAKADPLGSGRVAMLLPPVVAKAVAANTPQYLDIQERIELADGSAIVVTSRFGDAASEATTLAELLGETAIDRARLGALPFFRESLVDEAASAPTFAEAKRALGERVELLELRTSEERMHDHKKSVAAWLEDGA